MVHAKVDLRTERGGHRHFRWLAIPTAVDYDTRCHCFIARDIEVPYTRAWAWASPHQSGITFAFFSHLPLMFYITMDTLGLKSRRRLTQVFPRIRDCHSQSHSSRLQAHESRKILGQSQLEDN